MAASRTMSDYWQVREEELIVPREGLVQIYKDRWWVRGPEGLLFFGRRLARAAATPLVGSPQCNTSRELVEDLCPPGTWTTFIPWAYLPIRLYGEHDLDLRLLTMTRLGTVEEGK